MTNENYNPQIETVEIGVRQLQDIKIYPLSIADQLKFGDTIKKGLADFFKNASNLKSDIAVASFAVDLVKDSLPKILGFVIEDPKEADKMLEDITNVQASVIANIIYDNNYLEASKNLKGLFEKMKSLFQSERPLQSSVDNMEDIDSSISSDSATEKEA